jgi:uncharacterized protein HemX
VPSRYRLTSRSLRASACLLSLAALLALAGTPAPAALASGLGSGSALSELTEEPSEATTTATTATTATTSTAPSESGKLSSVVLPAIAIAVVLLMGIAFVIVRDARHVAPATDSELVEGSTARHSEAALRRRRAKAKAARRQRKRNR